MKPTQVRPAPVARSLRSLQPALSQRSGASRRVGAARRADVGVVPVRQAGRAVVAFDGETVDDDPCGGCQVSLRLARHSGGSFVWSIVARPDLVVRLSWSSSRLNSNPRIEGSMRFFSHLVSRSGNVRSWGLSPSSSGLDLPRPLSAVVIWSPSVPDPTTRQPQAREGQPRCDDLRR